MLPSDMVDNSLSPCDRVWGWIALHTAVPQGRFILSLSLHLPSASLSCLCHLAEPLLWGSQQAEQGRTRGLPQQSIVGSFFLLP